MVGGDGLERQVEHQPAGFARGLQRLGELLQRRGAGRVGRHPGDRGVGVGPGAGDMFRARNVGGGGEAAAGHQTASVRAALAAFSSRRQDPIKSRLKPA